MIRVPAVSLLMLMLMLMLTLPAATGLRAEDTSASAPASVPVVTDSASLPVAGLGENGVTLAPAGDRLLVAALDGPGSIALAVEDPSGEPGDTLLSVAAPLPSLGPVVVEGGRRYRLTPSVQRPGSALAVDLQSLPGSAVSPLPVAPGAVTVATLRPDAQTELALSAPADGLWRIEAFGPPDAPPDVSIGDLDVGSGIGPWRFDDAPTLAIVPTRVDGTPAPVVIRLSPAEAAPEAVEPDGDRGMGAPHDLGMLTAVGRRFEADLRAGGDQDTWDFTLDAPLPLSFAVDFAAPATGDPELVLTRLEPGPEAELFDAPLSDAARRSRIVREGQALGPGRYRLSLASSASGLAADYRLSISAGDQGETAGEGEPDDSADSARALLPGKGLTGSLSPGDRDTLALGITEAGHLWQLRTTAAVGRLELADPSGASLSAWTVGDDGQALAPRLALDPGRWLFTLEGEGRYAVRLSDLGPVPEGLAAEPDDDTARAHRLRPGSVLEGRFETPGDADLFEVVLAADTPLALSLTPPDDGALRVRMEADAGPAASVELPAGAGPVVYEAVFPAGRTALALSAGAGVSGGYGVALDRASGRPEAMADRAEALPGDGGIAGRVGGLDTADRVFVPLPAAGGTAAILCDGAGARGRVQAYGDDERLGVIEAGQPLVLDAAPALGGAVQLILEGGERPAPWSCSVRFVPQGAPGQQGVFDADGAAEWPLGLAAGALGAVSCSGVEAFGSDDASLNRQLNADRPGPEAWRVLRADSDAASVTMSGPAGASWSCRTAGPDALLTPQAAGPAAPFTALRDRATNAADPGSYDPAAALALISGGRPDWLTASQPRDDLPVSLDAEGLAEPLRAYSRAGQSAAVTVTVRNTGNAGVTGTLSLAPLAEGWRITPAEQPVSLAPGGQARLEAQLELPPMQSPAADPALAVTLTAHGPDGLPTGSGAVLTVPVTLDADAPDRGGHRFWTAPEGLRGGLNPLGRALGGRITALGDEALDEAGADAWAFLHDARAPHVDIASRLRAPSVSFALTEPAPVAGLFVQLRSAAPRALWPASIALDLSADGSTWTPALDVPLGAGDGVQVHALPAPSPEARFARIRPGPCRAGGCDGVALAEVGLIAPPGWRPATPVDIARPEAGGHVVTARALGAITGEPPDEQPVSREWNVALLTEGGGTELYPAREDRGDRIEAIIAFRESRAARIARIGWIAAADQGAPAAAAARVEASLDGPAGPWRPIGTLAPPPDGQREAWLELPAPEWARALRLTFPRDAAEARALPDRIAVIEDAAAPSVLGLWEDDRPEAGWEAEAAPTPPDAPAPTGGPAPGTAVPLLPGVEVASSVLLGRNSDHWRIDVPGDGGPREARLVFPGAVRPEFAWTLTGPDGQAAPLTRETGETGDLVLTALLQPGAHVLALREPPRSVAILWDTSGSVSAFIPRTLAAVRVWAASLQPGRDALQLVPFGAAAPLLPAFAEAPGEVAGALAALPANDSSDSETALGLAASALADRDGARGAVILTDGETTQQPNLWTPLLTARPRVVALSLDTETAAAEQIMKDWVAVNRGVFQRVIGQSGLADGLDLAAALLREPRGYRLTLSLAEPREPEGEGRLAIAAAAAPPAEAGVPSLPPGGAIEVVLDASGSMLQRMGDGRRRIEVAHEALARLVAERLPAGTPVAFRAFGLAPGSCQSELRLPLGPLDPVAAEAAVRGVPAINEARTAIADSLRLAAEDLAGASAPRVVVMVTDGDETCGGDVGAEIAAIRARGIDIRLTIVGFAIDDADLAARFAGWARDGGGSYIDAGDAGGLDRAMEAALVPRFALTRLRRDGTEEPGGEIAAGEDRALPAGRWRLAPLQTATGAAVEVEVGSGAEVRLDYDAAAGLSVTDAADGADGVEGGG